MSRALSVGNNQVVKRQAVRSNREVRWMDVSYGSRWFPSGSAGRGGGREEEAPTMTRSPAMSESCDVSATV